MENNKSQITTFYIVRHGEAEWNVKNLVLGHADVPLTERGEEQAHRLANELREIQFDEVFSSDLVRARRTAEIVTLERQLAVKTTDVLRERSFGILEGTPNEEFEALYIDWDKFTEEQKWNHKFADEESHEEVLIRFVNFIRETAVAYPGEKILIVAHGSLMRSFLIRLGYGTWDTIGGFQHCGYIHLDSDGIDFYLRNARGIKKWQDMTTRR
jgi:broad specificity phosphatase PhoE